MKIYNSIVFLLLAISATATMPANSHAQSQFILRIADIPGEGFFWTFNTGATSAISPGGTVVSPGEFGEFNSFSSFQNDVVGQWTLIDSSGNLATFDLQSVDPNDFPDVEIHSPATGDEFFNCDIVSVNSTINNSNGTQTPIITATSEDPNEVDAAFVGVFDIKYILQPNVYFAISQIRSTANFNLPLANVDDSKFNNTVNNNARLSGFSEPAIIRIFRDPPTMILGDVNRDGTVSLLDAGPLTDLIVFGLYQFEGDINGDGEVNILDIFPFIELIS